jgi:hypothetical protein
MKYEQYKKLEIIYSEWNKFYEDIKGKNYNHGNDFMVLSEFNIFRYTYLVNDLKNWQKYNKIEGFRKIKFDNHKYSFNLEYGEYSLKLNPITKKNYNEILVYLRDVTEKRLKDIVDLLRYYEDKKKSDNSCNNNKISYVYEDKKGSLRIGDNYTLIFRGKRARVLNELYKKYKVGSKSCFSYKDFSFDIKFDKLKGDVDAINKRVNNKTSSLVRSVINWEIKGNRNYYYWKVIS